MYQPNLQHQQQPPTEWKQTSYGKRKRRTRNWLLVIIIVLLIAILWNRFELTERSVPFGTIPNIPPITTLHPIVEEKQAELVAETARIGIQILITDGFRSVEEQDAIFEQGRTTSGPIVTQARGGQSYHNYGLAIDFALRTKKGHVIWDMEYDGNGNGKSDWMEVVDIAKKLGFSWGGDWESFKDYPHLQMDFGYSLRDLQRGKRPSIEASDALQ